MKSQTIAAGRFKARCLSLMDEVTRHGTVVTVTKHGRPVAKLVPAVGPRPRLFGALKGTMRIVGDIVGPRRDEWRKRR